MARKDERVELNDETVALVCEKIEGGLNMTQACARVGVPLGALKAQINRQKGNAVIRQDWRDAIDDAKAGAVETALEWGKKGGEAKNSAQVKFAEVLLKAVDPDRFRDDKAILGGGIAVYNFFGAPGDKQIVVRTEGPVELGSATPVLAGAEDGEELDDASLG